MAKELSGPTISPGDVAEVYSNSAIDIGTRMFDDEGNEYIFMRGVASTVVGSWVTYDELYDTTLLAANAKGPVAVAMGAHVANKFGWYQIWGTAIGVCADNMDDNGVDIGRTGTDGYVGVDPAAGDDIYGAICRSATEDGSANTTTTFQIYYPWVDDNTAAH